MQMIIPQSVAVKAGIRFFWKQDWTKILDIGKILFIIFLIAASYLLVLNARTSLLGEYVQTYVLSSGYTQLQRLFISSSGLLDR